MLYLHVSIKKKANVYFKHQYLDTVQQQVLKIFLILFSLHMHYEIIKLKKKFKFRLELT